jgi:gliding motility-associated-like protein
MKKFTIYYILLLAFPINLLAQYNGGIGRGAISEAITAPPDVKIAYPVTSFCKVSSPVSVTQTGTKGGTYSAFPSGLTLDAATGLITPGTSTIGTYTVIYIVPAAAGCSASDSLIINILTTITTNQDPVICQGDSIIVGTNYYSVAGTYKDTLTSYFGCDSIVTTNLTLIPKPIISLGNDTILCPGHSIVLTPGPGFSKYEWSDGTGSSNLVVTEPGYYSVTVYEGLCSAADTILIDNCGNELWVPNAFTPDNDGINDRFKPLSQGIIRSYRILIFNRWGQQVYESNDALSGWDGTFKGQPCPEEVYFYLIYYSVGSEPAGSVEKEKRGTVRLLN